MVSYKGMKDGDFVFADNPRPLIPLRTGVLRDKVTSEPVLMGALETCCLRRTGFEEVPLPDWVTETLEEFEPALRSAGLMSRTERLHQADESGLRFVVKHFKTTIDDCCVRHGVRSICCQRHQGALRTLGVSKANATADANVKGAPRREAVPLDIGKRRLARKSAF